MKKQKESSSRNTKIAIVFFILLAFFVSLSLVFKMVLVLRAGQFDDSKRFNLAISNNKNFELMSISGSTKIITVFKLNGNIESYEAGRFLEIPIDGSISSDLLNLNQTVNSIFLKAILNYKNLKTNLTIIDLLKLLILTRTIPQADIGVRNVKQDLSGTEVDKIVGRQVADELIEKDIQTIQIINGTDIGGFGNRLARLIANIGGDVIIVATSDSQKKRSSISYIDKKTYTVEKLSKILGYETIKVSDNAISDITITIGEDKVNSSPF